MDTGRYHRQEIFYPIGKEGQKKLGEGRVCIMGAGALGSSVASMLATAGVGFIRLIDRDVVELSNLQRQMLFTEADATEQTPKAEAARARINEINSEVEIEAHIADVNSYNIERFISDVDVVVDGLDNLETRYLLNEACHKNNIPYVYGGVVGSGGIVMNILPFDGPCLECLLGPIPEEGDYDTCDTVGVISPITNIVASYETAETMKILLGSESLLRRAISLDAWDSFTEFFSVDRDPECPVCGRRRYDRLQRQQKSYTTSLCGHDSYQVTPEDEDGFDYDSVVEALRSKGTIEKKKFYTTFVAGDIEEGNSTGRYSIKLFPDGRAIIDNVNTGEEAREVYSRYIEV